ncbi:MAG: peptidase M16 [Nitrospiraceae bacterium]|nr:peptidase M16 [Nitrospiraceae bacterium]|tara:strand:- start:79 stop:1650 length:1572 start_codon:yes stop_codon:yes gene_type:complete
MLCTLIVEKSQNPPIPHFAKKGLRTYCAIAFSVFVGLWGPNTFAQSETLADRVIEHRLDNGLTLLMVERHQAPIVSINLTFRVGSVNEHVGITGVAHLYEHMAFKGSKTLGTSDYETERVLLDKLDQLDQEILRERKNATPDNEKLKTMQQQFTELETKANALAVQNEFGLLYDSHGAIGLNASTSSELTRYIVSLPANRLPMWAAVESDRMRNPVLREFYKEKGVVLEERRLRTDNSPSGRMFEAFTSTAFWAHPYHNPVIGWPTDIANLTVSETQAFFKDHYGPNNAVLAIVGDIHPPDVIALIEATFGPIPSQPPPPPLVTVEPPQNGERRVNVQYNAEPFVLIGFHKPGVGHSDDDVFDVIDSILSSGRTSRMHKQIVQKKQLAIRVGSFTGFPGNRFPNLFVISAVPRAPHTTAELEEAVYEELDKLKTDPIESRELEKVINNLDAYLVRSLQSNSGLASQLTYFEAIAGDWNYLIEIRDRMAKITQEDIQRAANKYLVKKNRVVATLIKKTKKGSAQ